ncbi:MAG: leucine-rich repeat protein, partial [Lachnospiraceae bacterium]|nr:leucine-rich repeat protein [Lachnospiraceae bacterium]
TNAYANCSSLKELIVPGGLKDGAITSSMFSSMSYLEKLTIEEGIKTIEYGAFRGEYLVEVNLPDSLTAIPNRLFYNAQNLAKINPIEGGCQVNIPDGVTTIGDYAFSGCRILGTAGEGENQGRVKMPKNLENIGADAFYKNDKIKSIIFNDATQTLTIGAEAFRYCSSLEEIHFPEKLVDLTSGTNAYANCSSLKELIVPGGLKDGAITSGMFSGMQYLEKLTIEEGIKTIERGTFGVSDLVEVNLPDSLTAIPDELFRNAQKLAKINPIDERNGNLPKNVKRIEAFAFYNCKSLTGELYFPDKLEYVGEYAFYNTKFTDIHTSVKPLCFGRQYDSYLPRNLNTMWFRGEDDRDTVQVDGKTYGWQTFFDVYGPASGNLPKLYIETTVKHLTSQTYWKQYTDISFLGPNVITLDRTDGDIFSSAEMPVAGLDGTYYVTEEGVLYALNPVTGAAALAYCPPGITELYIPATIVVPADLPKEERYARSYKVVSVLPHSIMQASDLTAITAVSPQQITLGIRAFADCPTLKSVNGVTTQKEANALFGPNGTSAIKKAFMNTGLDADEDSSGPVAGGQPMRSLTYTDPNAGRLTIDTYGEKELEYRDGAYRLLTGNGVSFDLTAEAYGQSGFNTLFRIYFQPSDQSLKGFRTQEQSFSFTSGTQTYTTEVTTAYDNVAGCYCVSFSLPSGATWKWQGIAGSENKSVMYPGRTRGGELHVWGEIIPVTDTLIEDEVVELPNNCNYMVLDWSTERNLYEMSLTDRNNQAKIRSSTHRPYFQSSHFIYHRIILRDNLVINRDRNIGKDPVTEIQYHYTVTLPEGMVWNDEEKINISPKGKVISVSEDRRILEYEFIYPITDNNAHISGEHYNLNCGSTDAVNSSIVITDDYDFYKESEIIYICSGTVYYQFSEPDEMQEVTGREILKPVEEGELILERGCRYEEGRGRGLPITNYFKARNQSKDDAFINLDTITDEVVDYFNGNMYLSAAQIASLILDENEYIKTTRIEISKAVLYEGSFMLGGTHTGSDGSAVVYENRLNTYSEPSREDATLIFEIERDEDMNPAKITFSVDGGDAAQIELSADESQLAESIRKALDGAGYIVPTGLYKITWKATEALKSHPVEAYHEWEIGSYEATVKLDYEQAQRLFAFDSPGNFRFSDSTYSPTAKAVFTVNDSGSGQYSMEHTTRDTYNSSQVALSVRHYNRESDSFEPGMPDGLSPDVLLMYTAAYTNGNSVDYEDIPFRQELESTQCLLVPCERNEGLGDEFEKISVQGRDYYMLEPGSAVRELTGVWIGCNDGTSFYAESIMLGCRQSVDGSDEEEGTVVQWYEKSIGKSGPDGRRSYQFYTYVLDPAKEGERPDSTCTVYANGYKSKDYSARLYTSLTGKYRSETISKDIIVDPEEAGTANEKIYEFTHSSYIGIGESMTYRLSFDEYWVRDYTLESGKIYDLLPNTSGAFEWVLGQNVHVKYALCKRGDTKEYEEYVPEGEAFCHIEKRTEKILGTGEEKELYCLVWGDFVIPSGRTLYIYVTLDFPDDTEVWDQFVDAADTTLYNIFCWENSNGGIAQASIRHEIPRPTQAFLKIGMYGTDSDPYGYIYPNSDETERTVKYYLVIYNHGKSNMYLNPVHVKIPGGFILKDPPKYTYSGRPDWNCTDVSVTDENPPARITRVSVLGGVSVGYSEDGTEAILNIGLDDNQGLRYDYLVGKCFLKPGEYVAVEVRFGVDGYQFTTSPAYLAAAMPIDDAYRVGRIVEVSGVDAHRSNYLGSNEGIAEFWDSDEMAQSRGFADPNPSDTGKWVASGVTLRREEAKPGLTKDAPVSAQVGDKILSYDPQVGVAMEHPVKWETKLINGGRNSLTDYWVKDTIQWPYVFDGEVALETQTGIAGNDKKFIIERYYDSVMVGGNATEAVDRDRLKIQKNRDWIDVQIADSRAEALANPDTYSAEVFGGARVYFYKEDAFGDGNMSETMEIDLTSSRVYGIGPASYANGKTLEAVRILSYWTKYDLSKKEEAPRNSYCNKMILQPGQPYQAADIYAGIPIDSEGNALTAPDAYPDGIMAVNYVSVNAGQSTVAWMTVEEDKGSMGTGPAIADNINELLTRENKILLGDTDHTLTYTMNVVNHVANPSDTVQSAEDRKYSIKDMVIINTLPFVGDRMPFDSRVPRNSAYEIAPYDADIRLYYYDEKRDSESGEDDRKMTEMDARYYTVLYSTKQSMNSADWELSGRPDGWYTKEEFQTQVGDISEAKSIRIEIHDPTTGFDSSNPSAYRELMKAGRTIVVQYQAKIADGAQVSPGQCAWNSFGYRFNRFDGSTPMEASSIRAGVQIPAIPILYEQLIDYYQNPYVNPGEPQSFQFIIDKKEGKRTEADGSITEFSPQQISFTVTVGTDESQESKALNQIADEISDITWIKLEGDTSDFWEDGASYSIRQSVCPEEFPLFSITVNDQPTTDFIYNASYEPVIICKNQYRNWISTLYKMDQSSEGYDPTIDRDKEHIKFLKGALFGLYTSDETQKIDLEALKEEAGDKYAAYLRYRSTIDGMLEVSYGEDAETAAKLYLKDFSLTEKDGTIIWNDLKEDKYFVREIVPPTGYQVKNAYYSITRNNSQLLIYNEPGQKFLETGGAGTRLFYMFGAALLAAGVLLAWKRKKNRWQVKHENGEIG